MRVFLDANILFSAAMPDSPTRILLDIILRHASVVTNEHAWEEARRNIEHKRPHLIAALNNLKPEIEFSSHFKEVDQPVLPDNDQPIIGGAIASRCSHLWTGDKRHFGPLYGRTIQGTRIVSGIMLAKEVAAKGW
jgi:predicted nucleic acid-binding protein